MENKPKSDDFGTFLESVQRSAKPETPSKNPMRIMTTLSRFGTVDLLKLMAVVDIPPTELLENVKSLQAAGLVKMDESVKGGVIELTVEGVQMAQTIITSEEEQA
ncbi:MAG: hypothetical protein QMD04_07855 [Anaerolineales bacterium]|nr:hypothetical protein [Anaerolineales bacterium]